MQRDISFVIVAISIISGLLNFIFLGLSVALTSGGPEITIRELLANVCVWTSIIHTFISSWLFLYYKTAGRIIAILTSFIGISGSIAILTSGISILWILIALFFTLTLCIHFLT